MPLYLTFHDFTYTLEPSLPMDNYEIALEQQGGNDDSTPVGTHFTVRLEDKASFGRVLYEGSKIVGVPFMIATVLETDRKRFRFRLVFPTTKHKRLNLKFRSNLSPGKDSRMANPWPTRCDRAQPMKK